MFTAVLEFGDVKERDLLTVAFAKWIDGVWQVMVWGGIFSDHRIKMHIFKTFFPLHHVSKIRKFS